MHRVVELLIWETCGGAVAQGVQRGRVSMKLDLRSKAFLQVFLESTVRATVRCTSPGCMGLVTRSSLLLEDWELARVALSCHIALNMLYQEMHEAW